ncbi:hypothetical protein AX16_006012 [Volvariella volvacea WC 439]|nr:hypothetical protein AX16_006012 [Volvariella volvacea WC 439]
MNPPFATPQRPTTAPPAANYSPFAPQNNNNPGYVPPNVTPPNWAAATPAPSWGAATPAGSWSSPQTPASANSGPSPWIQNGPSGYPLPSSIQDSSPFGQQITATPYFNQGNSLTFSPTPSSKKKKRSKKSNAVPYPLSPQPHLQNPGYLPMMDPNAAAAMMTRTPSSHSFPGAYPSFYPQNGYSIPAYAQADTYDEKNLAKRPRDWREDYSFRTSLTSMMPRVGKSRSDVKEYTDPIKRTLCPLLAYATPNPPIELDLRDDPRDPNNLIFTQLQRPHNNMDFLQLATTPSCQFMRLYHPRLPWYIDVRQTQENGISVWDVLTQMYAQLTVQIQGRHFWNDELTDSDREKITRAFQERCDGDQEEISHGVLQVDFLGPKIIFEGLLRGKNGMWEIKTREDGL